MMGVPIPGNQHEPGRIAIQTRDRMQGVICQ